MPTPYEPTPRTWLGKFQDAFRGLALATRWHVSFWVHWLVAAVVVAAGIAFQVSQMQWCILVFCMGFVLVAEAFNTAIEELAKAVEPHENPRLGWALDVSSGAVLLSAFTAAAVGLIIFLPHAFAWYRGAT